MTHRSYDYDNMVVVMMTTMMMACT